MREDEAKAKLENQNIPLGEVDMIYEHFKPNKQIESLVAMNLSLRTSVYDTQSYKNTIMPTLLTKLMDSEDMSARWAVAKNPYTPVEVLKALAEDSVNLVRALVATNPATPQKILHRLFSDEKIVRDGLSGNPATPQKLLHTLADDKDRMVRMRVAQNPATSMETLERLSSDASEDVRACVKERLGEKR